MSKYLTEKTQLRQFLERRGVSYNPSKKTWRCLAHDDQTESAVLYENPDGGVLHCPVCKGMGSTHSWDIFALAELYDGVTEFKDKLKAVRDTLGIPHEERRAKSTPATPVALPLAEAQKIYTEEKIRELEKLAKADWGTITNKWVYNYPQGVKGIDIRFESPGQKKHVETFWSCGKFLRKKNPPVLIYNLMEALDETNRKPRLIHEGAKCAEAARVLGHFTSVSWSGGSGKAGLANWSLLPDGEDYIYPDDDAPGYKAAGIIKQALPGARVVRPLPAAREIKSKGADIVEALQCLDPEALTAYILDPANHMDDSDLCPAPTPTASPQRQDVPSHPPGAGHSSEPFKILGMANGEAHFIDQWGYYQHIRLNSLSKNRLNELADLTYWLSEFPAGRRGIEVDEAINYVICASKSREFDPDRLKGRGAWRSAGDKICYHDGAKTYGDPDPNNIYLKLPRRDMGLESEPVKPETLKRIRDIIFDLSFETKTDAVRTMGWSAIAPFCGALEFHPTLMLTGDSGHGKTRVQKLFIQPISGFRHFDLRTSSPAGVRRDIGKDSAVVFFDEAGKETEKMRSNFDDMIAFIRSNYSEDSPDSIKASMKDEGTVTYKLNSIFGLATTDPTIENIQDENRILRVNFIKPKHTSEQWQRIEGELKSLLCTDTCNAIRALIWSRLKIIIKQASRMVHVAKSRTGRDYRSSYADMLLAAAYVVVWCDTPEPTDEMIHDMLDKYYSYAPPEEHRNEAEEAVSTLMDTMIEVLHDHKREKLTIVECLNRIYRGQSGEGEELQIYTPTEIANYKGVISRHGIRLVDNGNIAIRNGHPFLERHFGARGYGRILRRHPGIVSASENVHYSDVGKSVRSTVLSGILREKEPDEKKLFDDRLGDMI